MVEVEFGEEGRGCKTNLPVSMNSFFHLRFSSASKRAMLLRWRSSSAKRSRSMQPVAS